MVSGRFASLCALVVLLGACDSCGEDPTTAPPDQDMDVRVEPPGPTEEPCGGCLDANDECQRGDEDDACGLGGGACAACEAGNVCLADGSCGEPPPCGPDTCDGCCDADGACVSGDSSMACGVSGDACTACGAGTSCQAGTCEVVDEEPCGASNCNGCCDATGACVVGTADAACGVAGDACVDCAATAGTCSAGTCSPPPACAATCVGCCAGDVCVMIPDEMQCGAAGGLCMACAVGEVCTNGACVMPPNPMSDAWDLTLLSANIPSTKVGGAQWDGASGPDPYMYMYAEDIDGYWENESSLFIDELAPVWNELIFTGLTNEALTNGITFWLADDELATDDICLQLEVVNPATITNQDITTTCTADPRVTWTWRLDPSVP